MADTIRIDRDDTGKIIERAITTVRVFPEKFYFSRSFEHGCFDCEHHQRLPCFGLICEFLPTPRTPDPEMNPICGNWDLMTTKRKTYVPVFPDQIAIEKEDMK